MSKLQQSKSCQTITKVNWKRSGSSCIVYNLVNTINPVPTLLANALEVNWYEYGQTTKMTTHGRINLIQMRAVRNNSIYRLSTIISLKFCVLSEK